MKLTIALALLCAQVSTATAAQGPKTKEFVNRVMGSSAPLDYPPFSADRMGSPEYRRCIAADDSVAHESVCLGAEYKRQDARLTAIFARALKSADPSERRLMLKAQTAWKQFRAANCNVRANNPGSGVGIFYGGCLVRETNQRIAEIVGIWDY